MRLTNLLAVAVISAAVLAYEVLLVRLFSIIGWHHFAYMIISIALLGFGASGTVIALARARLIERYDATFAACSALFAASAVASFALAARLPFNPLAIVWDPQQTLWLGATYLLLVFPFAFGGMSIGLAFSRYAGEIGRVYAFDLVGAGVGALGIVGVLFLVPPEVALRLVAALGLCAAALAMLAAQRTMGTAGLAFAGLIAALVVAVWLPSGLIDLQREVSQYKRLKGALNVPDAAVIEERVSPLALVQVVRSPTIPLRHAPGLSLANTIEPPLQLGIFSDAEGLSAITSFDGDPDSIGYLDGTTSALAYHLVDHPKVLILGAGGGEQVLLALLHRAPKIDAVELDANIVDLVAETYGDFAGNIYTRENVGVHVDEARSFVRRSAERYDVVQVPLLSSFGAAAAGTQSLHENYTYTVEALSDMMDTLYPGGLLSITLWLKLPPRDAVKLFATAVAALRQRGVDRPGQQLAMIRSWNTATILVKNGRLEAEEIAALRRFARARSFDLSYHPGIAREDANRYNVLEAPYLYEAAAALLGPEADEFIAGYKFQIAPASDDRPYFYDFFKWRSLPELWALRKQGAAMLDMGYLILFATLVQALVLSTALILAPLALRRRRFGGAPRLRTALYFLAIGLAFLFIEIAFIQRFVLFLGHPLYAVAVVLSGFLLFAGIGSALSRPLEAALSRSPLPFGALGFAVVSILALSALYLIALPVLFDALITLPDIAKIALSLGLIGPLALFMGMPFPLGVAAISRVNRDLVPWAWGINGCASVVSAILATLLAIHFGFTAVVVLAALLYAAIPFVLREPALEPASVP